MSDTISETPPEFKGLSTEERIRRVQQLWDFIAESPADVPIPDTHKRLLDERLTGNEQGISETKSWSEIRTTVLNKLRED